jgi:vitamin B12/bleomycin/antimicrobial peptide transport system ATP-binding/permease protein
MTLEDYQQQKAIVIEPRSNKQTKIEVIPHNGVRINPEISATIGIIEKLTHKEISALSDYSLVTIRSRASQGKPITTKDGEPTAMAKTRRF